MNIFSFCIVFLSTLFTPLLVQAREVPPTAQYLSDLGKKFYDRGQKLDAAAEFSKVLLLDPSNATAKDYLNKLGLKEGLYKNPQRWTPPDTYSEQYPQYASAEKLDLTRIGIKRNPIEAPSQDDFQLADPNRMDDAAFLRNSQTSQPKATVQKPDVTSVKKEEPLVNTEKSELSKSDLEAKSMGMEIPFHDFPLSDANRREETVFFKDAQPKIETPKEPTIETIEREQTNPGISALKDEPNTSIKELIHAYDGLLEKKEQQIKEKQKEIESLREEGAAVPSSIRQADSSMNSAQLDERLEGKDRELREKDEELDVIKEKIAEIRSQLEEKDFGNKDAAFARVDVEPITVEKVSTDLRHKPLEINSQISTIQNQGQNIDLLKRQIRVYEDNVSNLKAQIVELKQKPNLENNEKVRDLGRALEAANFRVNELNDQLLMKDMDLVNREKGLLTKEQEIDRLKRKLMQKGASRKDDQSLDSSQTMSEELRGMDHQLADEIIAGKNEEIASLKAALRQIEGGIDQNQNTSVSSDSVQINEEDDPTGIFKGTGLTPIDLIKKKDRSIAVLKERLASAKKQLYVLTRQSSDSNVSPETRTPDMP